MYPANYGVQCQYCSVLNTLYHMVWECVGTDVLLIARRSVEKLESQLVSLDFKVDLCLVDKGRRRNGAQGFPE